MKTTCRASITLEQWQRSGRKPVMVQVYNTNMCLVTRRRTVSPYGVTMMTFYFKPTAPTKH